MMSIRNKPRRVARSFPPQGCPVHDSLIVMSGMRVPVLATVTIF
jgi:hypothetical protein